MKIKLGLFFLAVIFMLSPCYAHSSKESKPAKGDAFQYKTFSVSKGGTLDVSISVGDIVIGTWDKNEVYVKAEGIDPDDMENVRMEQVGNSVSVSFHPRWGDSGRVRFTISVPSQFNTDLHTSGGDIVLQGGFKGKLNGSTSGGDIRIADVDGEVSMSTSGGDVQAGSINGTCTLHTSGGDIHVQNSTGQVELTTSGGDVSIGNVGRSLRVKTSGGNITIGDVGGEVDASTAGGDLEVGKVSGNATLRTAGGNIELRGASGVVRAKTAGGDVSLQNVSGSAEASTAGGNIEADLRPSGNGVSRLTSSGGDVTLYLPPDAKASIEAVINIRGSWKYTSEGYEITSDFKAKTYEKDQDQKEIHGTYVLNGGGEKILLETTNGNIYIRSAARK